MDNKIREIRKSMGMTQQQLADGISVSRSTIQKWEKNSVEMPAAGLLMISDFFNVSPEALMGKQESHSERNEMCEELVNIFYSMNEQGQKALLATAEGLQSAYQVKSDQLSKDQKSLSA